eukprot:gene34800-34211_t
MTVSDVSRILTSAEVQDKCRPKKRNDHKQGHFQGGSDVAQDRAALRLNPYKGVLAGAAKKQKKLGDQHKRTAAIKKQRKAAAQKGKK